MENERTKLRKKVFTIVEQAFHEIHGFKKLYGELQDKVLLSGQSKSTLANYDPPGIYNLPFSTAWQTLELFVDQPPWRNRCDRGIAYMGQNLSLHPHLHCIVHGGGIGITGKWKQVYAKKPFGGPEQVVEYLGRYTHKTAISNHRLLDRTKPYLLGADLFFYNSYFM